VKKFSERSQRGQRRIIICISGVVSIALIAILLLTGNTQTPYDYIMGIGQETLMPTITPADKQITSAPLPEDEDIEKSESEHLAGQENLVSILPYILNNRYFYDSVSDSGIPVNNTSLTAVAGIMEYGSEIPISEVTAGDVGIYGDSVCICVGTDSDGNAIFAYATPYESSILPKGGIYVGYSMEQNDTLFYGMYPVPCSTYYDCGYAEVDFDELVEKAENYELSVSCHAFPLYELGRLFSGGLTERVMDIVPETLLQEQNVKFNFIELSEFLKMFPEYAGIGELCGKEYCFREKKEFRLSTGQYIQAELVSLSTENYLECGGNWNMTLSDNGVIPFLDYKLGDYIGWGFVKAQKSVYLYDEEGNLQGYEMVDVGTNEGAIVKNEDGSSIYIDSDYSMTLEEEEMLLQETNSIIPLGDFRYLLISEDATFECDMSEYVDKGEAFISEMLERMLLRMNVEEEEIDEE